MSALNALRAKLRPGQVYRRSDLERWSNAVDRHISELVRENSLIKVSSGLYLRPKQTRFGAAPADFTKLVKAFLNGGEFLMVSANAYNGLGVGTTQLYNEMVVYNRKRHGRFELDGRKFYFRNKPHFPKSLSQEFLLVDLVNNLGRLAEEHEAVLDRVRTKALTMNTVKLRTTVQRYGKIKTKRLFEPLLENAA